MRPWNLPGALAVARLTAAAGLLALGACGFGEHGPRDVVVITLDTFRADRLEAYGAPASIAPSLDALARQSLVFSDVTAPAPVTLPSHASLFTGRYPPLTGVRNNGTFRLPESETTLAEVLRSAGYRTAAVVAAYPLLRAFGLAQGFERYDDAVPSPGTSRSAWSGFFPERRAEEVSDRALELWRSMAGGPRFLWVHYFDPHAPYDPPGGVPPDTHPYDAEVAYLDRHLGRLVRAVREDSPHCLVVVTADHGEALGEHGELSHGTFVYQSTLRVPWILSDPDLTPGVRTLDLPASLVDVMPTILGRLGLRPPEGVQGADLLRVGEASSRSAKPDRPIYAESLVPYLEHGFSAFRVLRQDSLKYTDATLPELYDLAADPGETTNLYPEHPRTLPLQETLRALVDAWERPDTSAAVALDSSAEAALRSLGYTAAPARRPEGTQGEGPLAPDPKSMKHYLRRFDRAAALLSSGQAEQASTIFAELAHEAPTDWNARYHLGVSLWAARRFEEARGALALVVQEQPDFAPARLALGEVQAALGQLDAARGQFQVAAELLPASGEPFMALARALEDYGRYDEAADAWVEAVRRDPASDGPASEYLRFARSRGIENQARAVLERLVSEAVRGPGLLRALVRACLETGHIEDARRWLASLRSTDPGAPETILLEAETALASGAPDEAAARMRSTAMPERLQAHARVIIARVERARGNLQAAEAAAREAVRMDPRLAEAYAVLGLCLEERGDRRGALRALRRAVELDPWNPSAREALGRIGGG